MCSSNLPRSDGGGGVADSAKASESNERGTTGGRPPLHSGSYAEPFAVFVDQRDPGYQKLLAMIVAGKEFLERESTRFDMPDFRPRADWVREMKRYGILPEYYEPKERLDVYAVEQSYWKSLWYRPNATH